MKPSLSSCLSSQQVTVTSHLQRGRELRPSVSWGQVLPGKVTGHWPPLGVVVMSNLLPQLEGQPGWGGPVVSACGPLLRTRVTPLWGWGAPLGAALGGWAGAVPRNQEEAF